MFLSYYDTGSLSDYADIGIDLFINDKQELFTTKQVLLEWFLQWSWKIRFSINMYSLNPKGEK